MSEFLHSNLESFEDDREHDSDITDLAVNGLSRAVSEDDTIDDGDYYNEYEEQHYGEERADFDEEELTLQEIPLPADILERYSFLCELPDGVAVMGGVARSIAREIITGEREPIRDIDLVNITDEYGRSKVHYMVLDALSRKFMPDDYAFGHGIEDDTLDNYFRTRDFTINQCLIKDGKLIVSDSAYNDFQENIIRLTDFERDHNGGGISGRLFLKALMMRGVLSQITDSIPLIEDVMEQTWRISCFDVALFLNKAMSRNAETARAFTEDLADWDIIPEYYADRPVALAKTLQRRVFAFIFRPSTDKRFMDVQECKDMDGFFVPPAMLSYHASDPIIRRAIAEYGDGSNEFDAIGERVSGRYTQAEYDDINRAFARKDDEGWF